MPIIVAMMRGINVGGQKIIRMDNLRASFEALGFRRVLSYVQSGNIIFEATKFPSDNLSKLIGERILSDYDFSVPVFLRTADEVKKVVSGNPFLNERGIDSSKLHVTFLSAVPAEAALGKLDRLSAAPVHFRIKGREIYLYCPNGYGRTKFSNAAFERLLSIEATTRNWTTVTTLARISSELSARKGVTGRR